MSNRKVEKFLILLALIVPFVLVACSGNLEEDIQSAAEQVGEVADQVGENAGEIADQAQEVAEEAVDAASEAVDAAADAMDGEEEMAEEEMAEEEGEMMEEEAHSDDMMGDSAFADIVPELDGTVVRWWHNHSGSREEQLMQVVNEFNNTNEYGIVVEATNEGGYGDIYDKMIAGLTTGELPGLVVAYQNQAAAYQVADGLAPLDNYINDPVFGLNEEERADFFSAFLNADRLPQFGGESFGWPPNRSMEVMYYNAEWLAELGYDAPPATPEQFVEMACAAAENPFSKNPNQEMSVGYEVRTDASNVASLAFARGVDVYDYENNAFAYNTPELAEALTSMAGLLADGCASLIAERFAEQTDFANGQTLFTMGSSSGLPFYASAVDEGEAGGFEWSVAPFPFTTDQPVQNIYGASVSIPKTDPVTQLASWIFIKTFTSTEYQADWVEASNYFPTRASVADGLDGYFAENPAYQTAFDLLQYGKTEPPVAGYDNVRDEAAAAFSRILDGEDAATVLAELDETANQILADAAP